MSADRSAPRVEEYKVKAVFMYNLGKFVDWPAGAFESETSPIVVCMFRAEEFGRYFERAVENGRVRGRGFVVRYTQRVEELERYHMLFVGESSRELIGKVLEKVRDTPALTVSDRPDFAISGGVVGFVTREGKVRLEFNQGAAEKRGIKISAKLLKVGKVVDQSLCPTGEE